MTQHASPASGPAGAGPVLVGVGIVILAVNLRPAAVSVGPVLAEIQQGLGMSPTASGLLTSLPVLAFAIFGAAAPRLAARFGLHRLTLAAMIVALLGIIGRAAAPGAVTFLLLSMLALAGMATANVLLPSLVKLHFPHRVGLLTALYSAALAVGVTLASVLTVPATEAFGGWRAGLGVWGATVLIALVPWLIMINEDRRAHRGEDSGAAVGFSAVARTRVGWLMVGFFGLQALQAYAVFGWFANIYRDLGAPAQFAGLLLGVVTGVGIPMGFMVPALTARLTNPIPLLAGIVACYPVGYLGVVLAPWAAPWLWAVLIGIGTCTFPMILTLLGLRARTASGTAALSGFTQSIGYLISAVGPFGLGLLHELTGSWQVPLIVLAVLAVPLFLVGVAAIRSNYLEDELPRLDSNQQPAD